MPNPKDLFPALVNKSSHLPSGPGAEAPEDLFGGLHEPRGAGEQSGT